MLTSTPRIRFAAFVAAAALFTWLAPTNALAGDAAAGKAAYTTNCASCHGDTGKGDGPVGAALPPPSPRDFSTGDFKFDTDEDGETGSDADLKGVITKGAAAFGGSALMAPWPTLSEAEVDNVIAFIRTLKE
jgi:mono/diheme cytochrome c family protein